MHKRYCANWTGLRNLKAQKFGNQILRYVSRCPVPPVFRVYLVAQVRQDSIFSSTVWLHYGGGGVWNLKSPPSSRLNKFVYRTDLYDSTPTAPSQIRQIHFVSVVADGRKWRQPPWGVIDHKPRTLVWVSCGGGVINSKQMELSIVRELTQLGVGCGWRWRSYNWRRTS